MYLAILYLVILVVMFVIWILVKYRSSPNRTKTTSFPMGELIYSDTNGNGTVLVDYEWGLKGKPDEIWRNNDRLHIVEIKSTYLPSGRDYPYHSHKMQLASYMRLAEAVYKLPVESGEIRYADGRRYLFNWDFRLKNELRETIEKMRKVDDRGRTYVEVKKSQCQRCYYYSVCDKKRFAR